MAEETDYQNLELDIDDLGQDALELAQFGFVLAPMSVNAAYAPTLNRQTGAVYTRLTSEAEVYKNQLYTLIMGHKRRVGSRAFNWQCQNRRFSFWIILRKGHKRAEAIDADNCVKLILDTFVKAGIVPDDRYCRDSRQFYADFDRAGWNKDLAFGVLVRWADPIEQP